MKRVIWKRPKPERRPIVKTSELKIKARKEKVKKGYFNVFKQDWLIGS
jgi:hypothetical protein